MASTPKLGLDHGFSCPVWSNTKLPAHVCACNLAFLSCTRFLWQQAKIIIIKKTFPGESTTRPMLILKRKRLVVVHLAHFLPTPPAALLACWTHCLLKGQDLFLPWMMTIRRCDRKSMSKRQKEPMLPRWSLKVHSAVLSSGRERQEGWMRGFRESWTWKAEDGHVSG